MKHSIAFAGFRHGHIFALYEAAKTHSALVLTGAWEADLQAKETAEKQGIVFTYDSFDSLLRDDSVDIVAIGDYYSARGKLAIAALTAGKHVIADKPLCTSPEEAAQIQKLAEQNNLAVGIMLDLRDDATMITAQTAIDSGLLGEINNIIFEGQHPLLFGVRPDWYFEDGKHGGVINDIAIHGIDLIRRFTRSDVADVLASRCWNFYAVEAPEFLDSAQFMLRMENGAGILADVSYAAPNTQGYSHPSYWHFRVWGEKGLMDFRANSNQVHVYLNGEKEPQLLPLVAPNQTYLDDFLHAINDSGYLRQYRSNNMAVVTQTLLIQQKAEGST